jgi:hypothetical protein
MRNVLVADEQSMTLSMLQLLSSRVRVEASYYDLQTDLRYGL